MSEDREFVLSVYPEADAVMLNKGAFFIGRWGPSKMAGRSDSLSGQFWTESAAWADAAEAIRESRADEENPAS